MPRSSLTPILRFADVELFLQEAPEGSADPTQLQGFVQVGVAKEDQPHYLRVLARPGTDAAPLVRFGLGVIGARAEKKDHGHDHGVISPVRTYESPLEHRMEDEGFDDHRDRHAPDEGDARPRRRAGPRAGNPLKGRVWPTIRPAS